MFFMGIIDCMAIPLSGFYAGYGAIVGMVFCMAPTMNLVIGSLSLGSWGAGSTLCMLLAINRCIDMLNPKICRALFFGYKVYFWFIIPCIWFYYFTFIHTSIVFNSNMYAYFFDPFLGTLERNGTIDNEHVRIFFRAK